MMTWNRTFTLGLLSLAVITVLASCGTADSDDAGATDDPGNGYGGGGGAGSPIAYDDDRDWLSTQVTKNGEDRPLVDGTQIRISFPDGQVAASAGCNSLFGDVQWDGAVMHVAGMGGTEMGCSPELMAQDEWLIDVLTSDPTVEIDGDRMTITSDSLVIDLLDSEVATPDQPLDGTTWVLDGIGEGGTGDGSMSSVPEGVRSTLTIEGQQISLEPGCNTGTGRVTVDDKTIDVSDVVTTLIACSGAKGSVEGIVLGVLEGTVHYSIDADTLTLTNGSRILVYRAVTG